MTKYHVAQDGTASLCQASIKACPLGEAVHGEFEDPREAQVFAERITAEAAGGVFSAVATPAAVPDLAHLDPFLAQVAREGAVSEQLRNGNSMLSVDRESLIEELKAVKNSYALDESYLGDSGVPQQLGITEPEARQAYIRSVRAQHPQNQARVAILERYVKKTPNRTLLNLLSYYKGESDYYISNVLSPESTVARIPVFSSEAVARDSEIMTSLAGKDPFKAKEFGARALNSLKKLCADSGLELEDAVAISAGPTHEQKAQEFAEENGLELKDSTELLFHGTNKANVLRLVKYGFEQEAGMLKSGAAAGKAFYFSHDPAVSGEFGRDSSVGKEENVSYMILCKVVTGGAEHTQAKDFKTSGDGEIRVGSLPKTLGRGKNGEKNVSRRITIHGPWEEGNYDEVTVQDARQIVPVGILKVRGKTRRAI